MDTGWAEEGDDILRAHTAWSVAGPLRRANRANSAPPDNLGSKLHICPGRECPGHLLIGKPRAWTKFAVPDG